MKVATVSKTGRVKIKKNAGGKKVIITATAKDGSGKKDVYKIKVMKGVVKKVKINGEKSVLAGNVLTLKADVIASKGANKKIKWTSDNEDLATVNEGIVKTNVEGKGKEVKIIAKATDGSGKKDTITIRIK